MQLTIHNSLLRLIPKKQNNMDNTRILRRRKRLRLNAYIKQKPKRTTNRIYNINGIKRANFFTRTKKNPQRYQSRKYTSLQQRVC